MLGILLILLTLFQIIFSFVYISRSKKYQNWDGSKRAWLIVFAVLLMILQLAAFFSIINSHEGKDANMIALILVTFFGIIELTIIILCIVTKTSVAFVPFENPSGNTMHTSTTVDWNIGNQSTQGYTPGPGYQAPRPPQPQRTIAPNMLVGTIIQTGAFARMSVSTEYFGARVIVIDISKLKVKRRAFPISEGDEVEVMGGWIQQDQQFKVRVLRNRTTGMIYRTGSFIVIIIIFIIIILLILARFA